MTITTWVINMAPVGVFFLIGGQVKDKPQQSTNFLFFLFSVYLIIFRCWGPMTLGRFSISWAGISQPS